jgi:hypothetical protein
VKQRGWVSAAMVALSMFVVSGGVVRADDNTSPGGGDEETSMEEYLEMQAGSEAFRAVADSFITVAARGDTELTAAMISPNLAAQAGEEAVANVVANQVIPFFSEYSALGKSVTITETSDQFGSSGYAYYMWMEPRAIPDAETPSPKPFVVYVVLEGDRIVIGNILVDHYVEGRH